MYDIDMVCPAHRIKMTESGDEQNGTECGRQLVILQFSDNGVDEKAHQYVGNPAQKMKQNKCISQHLMNQEKHQVGKRLKTWITEEFPRGRLSYCLDRKRCTVRKIGNVPFVVTKRSGKDRRKSEQRANDA